jgi:hypothetical protein
MYLDSRYDQRLQGVERCVWSNLSLGRTESGQGETTVHLTLHTDFALRVLGYLDTVRGRNGGIRLMREPRDINIGQVARDTDRCHWLP